ncbi:MAG TPA: O-antigen ligase family protein [Blastocatellia bacterium]|nr:O-antigen ligase family protein [Blastocatellia bacterium]
MIFEKIIFYALLLLLALTPLPFGSVDVWSTSLWEICVFALTLIWAAQAAIEGRLKIATNPLVLPMIALLGLAIVQILPMSSGGARQTISYDAFATSQAAIKIFASICFFMLFATFVSDDSRRYLAVNVIIAMCVLIALVGIGQSYIGKMLWQRGTYGPFINRNHFAGFLEMGVGLAGGLIIGRVVKQLMLAIYASCALAMCAGIALSASRGGVAALIAETVFLAIIAIPNFISSRKSKDSPRPGKAGILLRSAAAILLGFAAMGGATLLVGSERLIQNISQTGSEIEAESTTGERFSRPEIWSATSQLIKDHPYVGVGLGAYQFAYTRYDQSSGVQRVEQSHNDYLQIVADAGLVGGLIALVFVILLFVRGFSATQTRNLENRAITMGALAGCFAIAVHSVVEFNLQVTSNAQLFLALAAMATSKQKNHSDHYNE